MDQPEANEHYRALSVGRFGKVYENRFLSLGKIGSMNET